MRLTTLLLPSLLVAAISHAAQDPATAKKTGNVQGTVVEAISNQPIQKAAVILRKGEQRAEDAGIGAYTDEAGKFTLHDVDPGTYLISVERMGFVADPKTRSQTVTVNAEDAPEPIVLKLNRTGVVSGHVLDPDGEPATGASVQLQPLNPKRNPSIGASSDDRGSYRAYNIPPGRYKVLVTYFSGPADPRVKMQTAKDKAKETSRDSFATTYYPGALDPAQATIIQVEPGADLQGIDTTLRRIRTVRVRGKVIAADGESSTPLIMVMLMQVDGGNPFDTQVRADGSFELDGVPPGKYSISALGMLHGKQLAINQPLEVGETDIDGVQLTIGGAQTVTGRVLVPPDRQLPVGLVVALHSKEQSNWHAANQAGGFAQITEHGSFSLENVLPGSYDLLLGNVGQGDDLYVDSIRSGDQDILASGLQIGNGSPPPIELVLKGNGAQIDCTVLDEKHMPVPEANVTLLPDPPRRSQMALRAQCHASVAGKCTLLGIARGDYHAFATTREDSADFNDPATTETLEKQGKAITVASGDRKSIQIALMKSDDQQ